jgi:hypothetical protein
MRLGIGGNLFPLPRLRVRGQVQADFDALVEAVGSLLALLHIGPEESHSFRDGVAALL